MRVFSIYEMQDPKLSRHFLSVHQLFFQEIAPAMYEYIFSEVRKPVPQQRAHRWVGVVISLHRSEKQLLHWKDTQERCSRVPTLLRRFPCGAVFVSSPSCRLLPVAS
jgi:hypothetical protein